MSIASELALERDVKLFKEFAHNLNELIANKKDEIKWLTNSFSTNRTVFDQSIARIQCQFKRDNQVLLLEFIQKCLNFNRLTQKILRDFKDPQYFHALQLLFAPSEFLANHTHPAGTVTNPPTIVNAPPSVAPFYVEYAARRAQLIDSNTHPKMKNMGDVLDSWFKLGVNKEHVVKQPTHIGLTNQDAERPYYIHPVVPPPQTNVFTLKETKMNDPQLSEVDFQHLQTMASPNCKDELSVFVGECGSSELSAALKEVVEQERKNRAMNGAKSVMKLFSAAADDKRQMVDAIRNFRRQEAQMLSRLKAYEKAEKYGAETGNYLPLAGILGKTNYRLEVMMLNAAGAGGLCTEVPDDWKPKSSSSKASKTTGGGEAQ